MAAPIRQTVFIDLELDAKYQSAVREIDDLETPKKIRVDGAAAEREVQRFGRTADRVLSQLSIDLDVDESQLEDVFDLAERLDKFVATIDADVPTEELDRALALAIRLDNFAATIPVEAEADELREALGIAEKISNINVELNIRARNQELVEANRLADDLERSRTVNYEVEADFDRAELSFDSFLDGIDGNNIGQSIGSKIVDGLKGSLSGLGRTGTALTGIGVLSAGLFVEGFGNAIAADQANVVRAIQTGFSDAELARVGSAAADAYTAGFGESLNSLKDTAATILGELGQIDDDLDLEAATRQATILADVIGVDVAESVRLTRRLIANGLVPDTESGFDLLVASAQQFGNDFGEIFEVLQEFSPFFNRLGVDGATAANIIGEAWTQGLLPNIDRGAELFEEFIVEVSTGAEPARRAIEELGLSFTDIQNRLAAGDPTALTDVADALLAIDDDARLAALSVDIFRTSIEGAADPRAVLQLLATADAVGAVSGEAQDSADTFEAAWSNAFTEVTRNGELFGVEFSKAFVGQGTEGAVRGSAQSLVESFFSAVEEEAARLDEGGAESGRFGGPIVESIQGVGDALFQAGRNAGLRVREGFEDTAIIEGPIDALVDFGQQAEEIRFDRLRQEFADTAVSSAPAVAAAEEYEQTLEDLETQSEQTADAIAGLFDFGAEALFRDTEAQLDDLAQALAQAGDAINEFGSIDISSAAGRSLQVELEGTANQLERLLQGTQEGTISAGEFQAEYAKVREQLALAGAEAGLSEAAIASLIAEYANIPPDVLTEILFDIQRSEFDQAVADLEVYASNVYETTLDADANPAQLALASAEGAGSAWANRVYEAIVRARDEATPTIDRITRDRTVNVTVRSRGQTVGTVNFPTDVVTARGAVVGADGSLMMRHGGVVDGIARARPGGVQTAWGGHRITMAENGGDELFLNSKSPTSRWLELIQGFGGGRLDRELANHYTTNNNAPSSIVVNASTPVVDPVLAANEIARQIEHRLRKSSARSRWR